MEYLKSVSSSVPHKHYLEKFLHAAVWDMCSFLHHWIWLSLCYFFCLSSGEFSTNLWSKLGYFFINTLLHEYVIRCYFGYVFSNPLYGSITLWLNSLWFT